MNDLGSFILRMQEENILVHKNITTTMVGDYLCCEIEMDINSERNVDAYLNDMHFKNDDSEPHIDLSDDFTIQMKMNKICKHYASTNQYICETPIVVDNLYLNSDYYFYIKMGMNSIYIPVIFKKCVFLNNYRTSNINKITGCVVIP